MLDYAYRSITAIFTVLALLISAGSCTKQPDEDNAYSPIYGVSLGASQPTIHILQSIPELSLPLQQAADTAGLDGIRITVQTVPGPEDYRAALYTKLTVGEKVDVFHLLGYADTVKLQPYLEDLSDYEWVHGASGSTLKPVSIDGGVYGIPYALEGTGLLANRNIFEVAGIPLNGIQNAQSMEDAFTDLRDMIDKGELQEQFPDLQAVTNIPGQDTTYLAGPFADLLLYDAFSSPAQAFESQAPSFRNGDCEAFVKLMAGLSPHRYNWPALSNVTQAQVLDSFASGRIAVTLQSSTEVSSIYSANPALEGRLAFLPLYLENSEHGVLFTSSPAWWGVNAGSDPTVKEGSLAFLTWLYTSSEGTRLLEQELGILSPYRDAATTPTDSVARSLAALSSGESHSYGLAEDVPYGWGDAYATQLQEYFNTYDKKWDNLIDACEADWTERHIKN